MSALQHLTIGGRQATVAFMTALNGDVVVPSEARVAIATFADGGIAFYNIEEQRSLEYDESKHPRDEQGRWTDVGESGVNEGAYEYRSRSVEDIEHSIERLKEGIAKYPGEAHKWAHDELAKYEQELKFRADWKARQQTHPSEMADISGSHEVRPEDLRSDATSLQVGNETYYVGRGTGYLPLSEKSGESRAFEMMEGKIVVGPRKNLGKDVSEVPEAMAALQKQYDETVHVTHTGDFSKTTDDVAGSELDRIIYGYKSPLITGTYEPMLQSLTAAYVARGSVAKMEEDDPIATHQRYIAHLDEREPGWREKFPSMAAEDTPQYRAMLMLRRLGMGEIEKGAVSQATANDYAKAVRATQSVLAKEHPSGTITLYRGVQGDYAKQLKSALKKDAEVEMQVKPATSWSESRAEASKFAGTRGVVIARRVPISDVLFHWKINDMLSARPYIFGGTEEREVLVASRAPTMRVTREDVK